MAGKILIADNMVPAAPVLLTQEQADAVRGLDVKQWAREAKVDTARADLRARLTKSVPALTQKPICAFDEYRGLRPEKRSFDHWSDSPEDLVKRGLTRTEKRALAEWNTLSDTEIAAFSRFDPEAHQIAVDPNYRARVHAALNPPPPEKEKPDTASLREVVRAIGISTKVAIEAKTRELENRIDSLGKGGVAPDALKEIKDLLLLPVKPVYDLHGKVVGAQRVPKLDVEARLLQTEIADLKDQIKEIREKPSLRYCGVWSATTEYAENSFVTYGGSCWAAMIRSTGIRPGDGNVWRLAVKGSR